LVAPSDRRAFRMLMLALLAVAIGLVSCGGGGGGGGSNAPPAPRGTPPGNYTITVQAQGAGFADSFQLQLTVK